MGLPNPGIEPVFLISPASERRFFTASTIWEAHGCLIFEANWEGEKARLEGTSFNDQEVKKIVILKCRLLFLCNECTVQWWFKRFYKGDESLEDEKYSGWPWEIDNSEPFLDWIVTCNKKWIVYNNWWWPAQWLDWEEAPKHFPKPNLHQKKIKLVVCLANGHDVLKTVMPAASLGQKKGLSSSQCLNIHCTINAPKVEHIRLQSFASYAISIWPLTN